MRDRIFIDTNILVYSLLDNGSQKHKQIMHLMELLKGNFIFISTQILNELYVSLLKHNIDEAEEDMQDGQIIEDKLRIVDPFAARKTKKDDK
jgi:predicted nucleic acid-binding protein